MDATVPDLLRNWAAAGELPNVARLLEQGTPAEVEAPPGPFVRANGASTTRPVELIG